VDVRKYGAVGDGVTNDAAAIQAALTATGAAGGGTVLVPEGTWGIGATLSVPDNVVLRGVGKKATIIKKLFNGNILTLGERSGLVDLTLDGNGAAYNDNGVMITGTNGRQSVTHVRIIDTEDYAVSFEILAGSQSSWNDVEMYQVDGLSEDQYAIYIPNTLNGAGTPRKFHHIETSGKAFVDLGGCNGFFLSNSFVGGIKFRSESRGAYIIGSRLGVSQFSMFEVHGYNHVLSGNNIGPSMTVMPGAQYVTITANTHNGFVYDNSTAYGWTNHVEIGYREYTPTLTTVGDPPTNTDNSTIRGTYSRTTNTATVCIDFIMGATTTLGTNEIMFSIPSEVGPINGNQEVSIGSAWAVHYDNTAQSFVGVMAITPSVGNVAKFNFSGASPGMTATFPFTWAVSDSLRGCITYPR
jgi:hypothetical protein